MSMKKEKPLILLSNDDGVNAKGLNELIRALRGLGEIIVMARTDRVPVHPAQSLLSILSDIIKYAKKKI